MAMQQEELAQEAGKQMRRMSRRRTGGDVRMLGLGDTISGLSGEVAGRASKAVPRRVHRSHRTASKSHLYASLHQHLTAELVLPELNTQVDAEPVAA